MGDLGDKLNKNRQPAETLVREAKKKKVDELTGQNKHDEAIRMLQGSSHFEMKFDTIGGKRTLPYYESMVDIFLSDSDNRFSAMIVDRQNPAFNNDSVSDAWETYTKYIALLVVREMKNLPSDNICLVVDEITKPHTKPLSLEDTMDQKKTTRRSVPFLRGS